LRHLINHLTADTAGPNLLTTLQETVTDPGRMVAFATEQHNIGDVNWRLSFYYTRLPELTHGSGMSFDKVNTLYQYLLILGVSKTHLSLLPLIFTGDNQYGIILPDLHHNNLGEIFSYTLFPLTNS